MTDKKDRQEWIDFVIESFYNPCVKLTRIKGLTFDEFAKIFHKSISTINRWKHSGYLTARTVGGMDYYSKKEIELKLGAA